jgi:alkylation response protein AidB-like acyl-CoA dehydrogenase
MADWPAPPTSRKMTEEENAMSAATILSPHTLSALADGAEAADRDRDWPTASWRLLREAGVLAWSVPPAFGGVGLSPTELLTGYEILAGACLTTTFILSQREAAVRRLLSQSSPEQQRRWLPPQARGDILATVGLSQLTTSRQHLAPSLIATPLGPRRYRLDGVIPWVTAADRADETVVGATLPDGLQVLVLLPGGAAGMTVEPPLPLSALAGSRTALVRCHGVELEGERILAGPTAQVLAAGKSGVGGVETSCLGLGLAGATVDYLEHEAAARPDLAETAGRFGQIRRELRRRLHELADGGNAASVVALRVDCTMLALQATQSALATAKGTGFVTPHPVQRWARQALFFLVWSCPRPAAEGILTRLLP